MHTPAPAQTKTSSFRLEWWSLVAALVLLIIVAIRVGMSPGGLNVYGTGTMVGSWIGGLIIAGILGTIGYFVARRSTLVFNICFVVGLCLAMLGQMGLALKDSSRKKNAVALQDLSSEVKRQNDEALAAYESGASFTASERVEKLESTLKEKTAGMSAEEAKIVNASLAFAKELAGCVKPYDDSLAVLFKAGGIDHATLKSREAIAARIDMVNAAKLANDDADIQLQSALDRSQQFYSQQGLPPNIAIDLANRIKPFKPVYIELRENQRQLCTLFNDILTHLRDSWGTWESQADGTLLLSSDAAVAKYQSHVEKLTKLSAEEERLMRTISQMAR